MACLEDIMQLKVVLPGALVQKSSDLDNCHACPDQDLRYSQNSVSPASELCIHWLQSTRLHAT